MGLSRKEQAEEKRGSKEKPEEKQEKKPAKQLRPEKKEMKTLVRVLNTDLDGERELHIALMSVKGIGHTMSKAVVTASGFDPRAKLSTLTEADIQKIEGIIREPLKFGIPVFLVNRRRDMETGKDMHVSAVDMDTTRKFDIQRMVDAKTYKGTRHMLGLPARGQRTRSSFRKGRVVGVVRKAVQAAMKKPEEKAAAPAAAPAAKEAKK
jgi:small subunit ribosomal protein S13